MDGGRCKSEGGRRGNSRATQTKSREVLKGRDGRRREGREGQMDKKSQIKSTKQAQHKYIQQLERTSPKSSNFGSEREGIQELEGISLNQLLRLSVSAACTEGILL